jgi:Cof subfamily protein (haloacid dehalogenase superfamily)
MPRISLLLADVDGTLVTEQKVLTERAQAAVAAMRARGVRFAITSGRPPRGMAMLIEPLALDTPIAGFNGGAFVRPDLSVIETRSLAPEVARQAIAIILDHRMDAWLYTGTEWLIHDDQAPHVTREQWTVKFPPKVVARYADTELDQAVKIVGVSDDHDLVARCEADVSAALGDRASARRSQPYYLDVTHPRANKGAVVDELVRTLGIPAKEIATIGDMPNDVLMFERSGFSIAMGNASDEVKSRANVVTDSYNDEGFAKAVERYILDIGGGPAVNVRRK